MTTPLPSHDATFARLALQLGYVSTEHLRTALDLYRRYQAAGGAAPSLPSVLVQKGFLARGTAEQLLHHVLADGPLPPAAGAAPAPPPVPPIPVAQADAEKARTTIRAPQEGAEREALLKGLGATVMRGEIKGYKILNVVGEGSIGCVYRAHQISMDRIVALKVLTQTKNQAFVEQFLAEARNAGRLNHPNLIRVHEVGRSGELYYYSMEYVDGVTIGELMDEFEGGRLDPKRAVNIFLQVAAALDHGMRLGITHREIRPKSIMITEGDQAKLDGLGLAQDEETRFLEGENAHYVAPEQVQRRPPDARTDIYSLGCCLFHALTGEAPFQGGTPRETLARRLMDEPPNPLALRAELSPDQAAVCMKMMARDPQDRYQTPAELSAALRKVALGGPKRPQLSGGRGRGAGAPARGGYARGRTPRRRYRK